MKLPIQNGVLTILFVAAIVALSSCVKPIPPENLVPEQLGNEFQIYNGPLYQAVSIDKVGGGKETDPMLHADIGSAELKEAITRSLNRNNYLSSSKETQKYTLNIFLVEIDRPRGGLTMSVTTFVKYKFIDLENNRVVFDEIIDASDTKTVSDAFAGVTRIKISQEDSMKKNIVKLLEKLFSVNKKLKTEN